MPTAGGVGGLRGPKGDKGDKGDPGEPGSGGMTQQNIDDAVAAHVAASDPHATYTTASEVTGAIAAHAAASDPHTAYVLEANLAAIAQSGDASDLGSGTVALARMHANVVLTNDARLSDARTPTAHNQAGETITSGTVAAARLPMFGTSAAGIVPQSGGGSVNFLRADGTWNAPPVGSGPAFVKKTSSQNFNSASPADVSGMAFALTAGRYYYFKWTLLVRSDTATVGVAVSLTFPSMTEFGATIDAPFAADGAAGRWRAEITSSDDAGVPTAIVAINTTLVLTIEGSCVPSANGNLQLRMRTETGTTVVQCRQGSCGLLFDLGT